MQPKFWLIETLQFLTAKSDSYGGFFGQCLVAAKFSIAVLKFSLKLSLGRWRLSLDTLGVDLREVDFSGGRIGFGRYIGDKTYVSVSQELADDHGHEVALEYQVAPNWKIGTKTSSSGSNGIDISWNKRY